MTLQVTQSTGNPTVKLKMVLPEEFGEVRNLLTSKGSWQTFNGDVMMYGKSK